jgi:hypothetical protein
VLHVLLLLLLMGQLMWRNMSMHGWLLLVVWGHLLRVVLLVHLLLMLMLLTLLLLLMMLLLMILLLDLVSYLMLGRMGLGRVNVLGRLLLVHLLGRGLVLLRRRLRLLIGMRYRRRRLRLLLRRGLLGRKRDGLLNRGLLGRMGNRMNVLLLLLLFIFQVRSAGSSLNHQERLVF